jgi:phage host-nuclease inhibitor protein Gam
MSDTADLYSNWPHGYSTTPVGQDGPEREANRHLRTIRGLMRERSRLKEDFDTERALLDERETELIGTVEGQITALTERVKLIHQAVMADDPALKAWRLAYGTIGARQHQPSVVLDDAAALLAWARDNAAELVTRTEVEKVDTVAAKRRVTIQGDLVVDPDGEIVAGFRVKPAYTEQTVTWLPEERF